MIINTIKTLKLTKNRRFRGNFVSGQTTFQLYWTCRHTLFLKIRGGYVKVRFFYGEGLSGENQPAFTGRVLYPKQDSRLGDGIWEAELVNNPSRSTRSYKWKNPIETSSYGTSQLEDKSLQSLEWLLYRTQRGKNYQFATTTFGISNWVRFHVSGLNSRWNQRIAGIQRLEISKGGS